MSSMGALQDAVQFILHLAWGAAPRAQPVRPGNAGPQVAHAFNVQVVRIRAHVDQANELVIWNVASSNAGST